MLFVVPILGPATFTLVSSTLLPLTIYRVAFAITVGVAVSRFNGDLPRSAVFKSTLVKIVFFFALFVIIVSLGDRSKNLFFSYIPELVLAFLLCFVLIRDEEDLFKLGKIFVWQGALIGVFIILEYFTDFDISVFLRSTVPGYDLYDLQAKQYVYTTRAGFFRASGIDGNAVQTGYRLAFLFPLTLWYASRSRKNLLYMIPLVCVSVGLIFLQTRAALGGILVGCLVLFFGFATMRKISIGSRLALFMKLGVIAAIPILFVMIFSPTMLNIATGFWQESVVPTLMGTDIGTQSKTARIPVAIDHFLEKPFWGHGSPQYAYYVVMHTDDIPSLFIYLLSGGIFLGILFLVLIYYLPKSVLTLAKRGDFEIEQREFLLFSAAAFVAGVVVIFSNWQEAHFMIMYMLYISIYKVYVHNLTWTSQRQSAEEVFPVDDDTVFHLAEQEA